MIFCFHLSCVLCRFVSGSCYRTGLLGCGMRVSWNALGVETRMKHWSHWNTVLSKSEAHFGNFSNIFWRREAQQIIDVIWLRSYAPLSSTSLCRWTTTNGSLTTNNPLNSSWTCCGKMMSVLTLYLLVFACCWFVCLDVCDCVSSFFDLSSSLLVMALSRTWVDWQTWDIYVWDVTVHDWVLVPGAPQVFQWMDGH